MQQLLEIMELRWYARIKAMVEEPDSDEESLLKRGVTQDGIDLVMDNMARAMRG